MNAPRRPVANPLKNAKRLKVVLEEGRYRRHVLGCYRNTRQGQRDAHACWEKAYTALQESQEACPQMLVEARVRLVAA